MAITIARRRFITVLGSATVAWPIAARAQLPRRIGVLMAGWSQTDREGQAYIAAFLDTFQRLGWTDGRNVRIERTGMPPRGAMILAVTNAVRP
jgi:putative ABC transport system substrate-binding protein